MKRILFTPYKINHLEIKNRIIMTGMHLGYSLEKEIEFYKSRAKGGAGAIIAIGGINDVGTTCNMIVLDNSHKDELKELANSIHENGSTIFFQIFHAGRNGKKGFLKDKDKGPVAPSVVPSPIFRDIPKELTIEEIKATIDDFGKAALICKQAGIDGVEISCSAGYLLSQFLSPLTNLRNDEYGGTEENRMRFSREVLEKVREYVGPDYPIILRISGSDMLGGYGIDFMKKFCSSLDDTGLVDAINVTGGWHEAPIPQITASVPEGGFSFLAGEIKRVVSVPVIACNRINNGEIAEEILQKGLGDFVGCARAFLTDPEFANKIEKEIPYRKCIACNKGCIERVLNYEDARCIFNPGICVYPEPLIKANTKKKVLVIGAGPAGMEAAKYLSLRNHDVTLCSGEDNVGGLLHPASKPPHKGYIRENIDAMKYEIEELGVTIKYNTKVDEDFIKTFNPDYVIVATGSTPIIPPIKGINQSNVYLAEDVLKGDNNLLNKITKGKIYIIGGGAVGLETAHFLAEKAFVNTDSIHFIHTYVDDKTRDDIYSPIEITVVEMLDKVGKDLGGTRWIMMNQLKQLGVKICTSTKVLSIQDKKIVLETKEGESIRPADSIILAIGYTPNSLNMINYLKDSGYPYTVIGDSRKPSNISGALLDAYEVALTV